VAEGAHPHEAPQVMTIRRSCSRSVRALRCAADPHRRGSAGLPPAGDRPGVEIGSHTLSRSSSRCSPSSWSRGIGPPRCSTPASPFRSKAPQDVLPTTVAARQDLYATPSTRRLHATGSIPHPVPCLLRQPRDRRIRPWSRAFIGGTSVARGAPGAQVSLLIGRSPRRPVLGPCVRRNVLVRDAHARGYFRALVLTSPKIAAVFCDSLMFALRRVASRPG